MTSPSSGPRIVVDAMGGDFAPDVNIRGALDSLKEAPDLTLLLVGDETTIRASLKKNHAQESSRLFVVHAPETITMEDHAASAIRKKKNSSIHVGLGLVKDGKADAFISAGNSGAVMAAALFVLGRIAEVERPAIVVKLPHATGFTILLDAGANVDCRPSHLVQFAVMGQIYAEVIERNMKARIGLLSNGSESHKGNELTRETHALLTASGLPNYIGYIEGYDIFEGTVDVIVTDGFVGNVCLKLAEGLAETAGQWFKTEIKKDWLGIVGVTLLKGVLKRFKQKFDYQPYGAAPLLGINGMVLISHGGSTDVAIRNGILTAKRGVEQRFPERMSEAIHRRMIPSQAAPQ